MTDVAESVVDILVTAGIGVKGTTLFVGRLPTVPDLAIAAVLTGGTAPNPKWLLDFPSVQVLVRGDKGGYQAAYTKAQSAKDALLGFPSQDINGDRFVSITQLGDLAALGFDESNRPLFSLNLSLIIEPATGTNRTAL